MTKRIDKLLLVPAWLAVGVFFSPMTSPFRWVAYALLILASSAILAHHRKVLGARLGEAKG